MSASMSGTVRSGALLATGVVVGLVAGYGLRGLGASDASDRGPQASPGAVAAAPGVALRVEQLERDLATERAARARAEALRGSAAAVGAGEAGTTAVAGSFAVAAASGPGARAGASPAVSLDPTASDARARALEPEVARVLEAKDGPGAIALLRELGQLGRAGWPLAAKIVSALERSATEGKHEFGVSFRDFLKAATSGDMPDLLADAIANPQGYAPELRRLAAERLPWTDRDGTEDLYLRQLSSETDEYVARELADGLAGRRDPATIQGLLQAYRAQATPGVRSAIVDVLDGTPGPEAARALAEVVASESDPEVKRDAEVALQSKDASVTGFLVTDVSKGSQAERAGVLVGDVLTAYNGVSLQGWNDLTRAKQSVPAGASVVIQLARSGQSLQVTLAGGQMGVNGRFVAPAGTGVAR